MTPKMKILTHKKIYLEPKFEASRLKNDKVREFLVNASLKHKISRKLKNPREDGIFW